MTVTVREETAVDEVGTVTVAVWVSGVPLLSNPLLTHSGSLLKGKTAVG